MVELLNFKLILKNYKYGNNSLWNILKSYVLNSYIITKNIPNFNNIITDIIYQSDNIVIIRDYNILYLDLSNGSFNFDKDLLAIVLNSITYQINILNNYYSMSNVFYKQLINYNYLDIKNIVINITNNDI